MSKSFDVDEILMVFSILSSIDPKAFDIDDEEDPEALEAYAVWYKLRAAYNLDGHFTASPSIKVDFEED